MREGCLAYAYLKNMRFGWTFCKDKIRTSNAGFIMYERMNKFYVVDTMFRGRDIIRFLKKHSHLNKEKVEEIK